MGLNLESRRINRRCQQQPVSGWTRTPAVGHHDHPVRIHTLGRFSIQRYLRPVATAQARCRKPLELLQALIAMGGRGISSEQLSQALWPDADGDAASNSFDVTLHRLRRLLNTPDLLPLRDHRLSLNSDLAWVDAWTFERLVNHAERLLEKAGDPAVSKQLASTGERLLTLYQGGFLEREAGNTWSLTLRERLRSKLLRHILEAGVIWEQFNEWGQAIRLYHKGLEVDPLTEELYQCLIRCFKATGRRGDALAAYQRCQDILYEHFQIRPSKETLKLYASIKA
jgi:DNA-binding SARP family transcriptional activator